MKTLISCFLITLLASGCLKFSDDGGGSSSSSSSSPTVDVSVDQPKEDRVAGTIDLRPRNSLTISSSSADPNKLNGTYITIFGNGKIPLSKGKVSDFGVGKTNSIPSRFDFDFIVVKEDFKGRIIETVFKGNLIDINYKLKL